MARALAMATRCFSTAGELAWIGALLTREANALKKQSSIALGAFPRIAPHLNWRLSDVAEGGEVRKQIEVLENHGRVASRPSGFPGLQLVQPAIFQLVANKVSIDVNTAPKSTFSRWLMQRTSSLAGTRWTDQTTHFTLRNSQTDVA